MCVREQRREWSRVSLCVCVCLCVCAIQFSHYSKYSINGNLCCPFPCTDLSVSLCSGWTDKLNLTCMGSAKKIGGEKKNRKGKK